MRASKTSPLGLLWPEIHFRAAPSVTPAAAAICVADHSASSAAATSAADISMPLVYSSPYLSQYPSTDSASYRRGVTDEAPETLTERFNRLTAQLSETHVASIMGVTEGAVRKLRRGDTQSYDLKRALRLCRELGVSPWYLACESEPTLRATDDVAGSRLPEGPTAKALHLLRAEVLEVKAIAEQAKAAAEEARLEAQRLRRRSA